MMATPPIWRWRILPPRTPCWRTPGPARRWSRSMAARCGWWCRISISGKAPSGCRASNFSPRTSPATGRSAAITTAAIRGMKSAIPATEAKLSEPWRPTMPTERFQFTSSEGHQLAAALDLPEGTPLAYALFAHCFTCGKDVLAAKRIAVALAAKGIAVLRFDVTGLGSSEGDFANSTFSSNVADLVLAADHLRQTRKAPAILIGHSLGGAAILAAAGQIPEAKAVVSDNATHIVVAAKHPKSVVSLARADHRLSQRRD